MTGKGIRYEWACKRELERRGNVVLRMAASHGPFDLVAFHPGKTGFFQLKTNIECNAADSLLATLPRPYAAHVVVVHRCRATCRRKGYVPQTYCTHIREPLLKPSSYDGQLPTSSYDVDDVESTTLYVP